MSIGSFFLTHVAGLPRTTHRARVRRTVRLAMPDGIELVTRVFSPRGTGAHPTILMRLPYGFLGFSAVAMSYAERGFNCVLQACRGTDKSGGEFDPLVHERADGLATLDWIKGQSWYDGRLGLSGPSYLGYAQWAISDALPANSAMATKVTSSEFRSVVLPSGAFHVSLWLSWIQTLEILRTVNLGGTRRLFSGHVEKTTLAASMTLPLVEADRAATGHEVSFWRRWFANALDNPAFWTEIDHSHRLSATTPPNHFMSGWYDFMVDQLLRDYQTLVSFGHKPYLTIGAWWHVHPELQYAAVRETLIWMRAELMGDRQGLRAKPVRLEIGGIGTWHEFDSYPPGPPADQVFYLAPGSKIERSPPATATTANYRYDPADPTPNLGGAIFAFTGAGPVDNAPLETRADLLVYTSDPLTEPLTIIGQPTASLSVSASVPHLDLFIRLSDVDPAGISRNVCDGFTRITPETERTGPDWAVTLKLHATAHSFRPGHRLRLLIASGAHPRYARNLGTDEPLNTATTLVANDITIEINPHHPAMLTLPTYEV